MINLREGISPGWVHPSICGMAPHIQRASETADDTGPATARRVPDWVSFYVQHVRKWAPGVYSVPYLAPALCIALSDHFDKLGFEPNEDEEPEARINECVLNHTDPALFTNLNGMFYAYMRPLANLLLQLDVKSCLAIQGAVYTPDGTSGTAWHKDIDSEFTVTVALSEPKRFNGGGTSIWRDDFEFNVPPLPIGHALLFAGRTTLHKGDEVIDGARHLLVHWANQNLSNLNMH